MTRVLAALLVLVLLPGAASAAPCNTQHPCPTPTPSTTPRPLMGRVYYTGFETANFRTETSDGSSGLSGSGTTYDSVTKHTGTYSFRLNLASLQQGFFSPNVTRTAMNTWARFYLRIATMPTTVNRHIAGGIGVGSASLHLTPQGRLRYHNNTTLVTTSAVATAMTTGQWYMIEYRAGSAAGVVMRINGVDEGGSVSPATGFSGLLGNNNPSGAEASAIDIYFDDYSIDDSAWPGEGAVVLLLPTADSAVGSGWQKPGGATTNLWTSVNNTPPVGVADSTSSAQAENQIRNATAAANTNYDATMTTYTAAGIAADSTVNSVVPIIWTAAPVSTSAKQGTVGVASNPAIANVALSAGGVSGAFWSGTAAGTFPTGWKLTRGTMTSAPAVTLGTAPVMRVTQVTSSTRIAMVSFMAMYVDYSSTAAPAEAALPAVIGAQSPATGRVRGIRAALSRADFW